MSAVGSLLVRDRVLSLQQMEAALHRQRIDGGELESVLLDMALVPENVLNAYRAAVYDLFPATREELRVDHVLGAPLTKKQWSVLRALPFSEEKERLCIAVAEPMDPAIVSRLERDTGKNIAQRIITSLRLNIALSEWARLELSARDDRIARKLAMQNAGVTPFVKSPESRLTEKSAGKTGRRQRIGTLASTPANDPLKNLLQSAALDFEYVALFEARGELACGIASLGKGADTDAISAIAVPLDIPSALSVALESRAVTEVGQESLDLLIRKDVGRESSTSAVIIPLAQGERNFLLYADRPEQAGTTEISNLHRARSEFEESHVRGLPAGIGGAGVEPNADAPTTVLQTPSQPRFAEVLHIPHTAPPPPSLQEVRGAAQKTASQDVRAGVDWLALVMQSKGRLSREAKNAVLTAAPRCIPLLADVFPGRLRADTSDLDVPLVDISSVCEALLLLADDYSQELAALLEEKVKSEGQPARICAIRLCGCARVPAVQNRTTLWSAVAKQFEKSEGHVQRAAGMALRHRILHAPLSLPELKARYASLRVSNASQAGVESALDAVAEIRDPGALPALFTLLSNPTHGARAQEIASLVTGLNLGKESSRWRVWHQQNADMPRFLWLVDALDNPTLEMRKRAVEELSAYVGDRFGYHPTAPKSERKKAQQRFKAWHAN